MSLEYYFAKKLTLKQIKEHTKNLTFMICKEEKVAIIKDKYDNYLQAFYVEDENSPISFFNSKSLSGGFFIIHEIALGTNTLFITSERFLKLQELLDKQGIKQVTFNDERVIKLVKRDLEEHYLSLGIVNGKYVVLDSEKDDFEGDRKMYLDFKKEQIEEEIRKDYNALRRQIEKMNKTNISKVTIIANLDTSMQESKTPILSK